MRFTLHYYSCSKRRNLPARSQPNKILWVFSDNGWWCCGDRRSQVHNKERLEAWSKTSEEDPAAGRTNAASAHIFWQQWLPQRWYHHYKPWIIWYLQQPLLKRKENLWADRRRSCHQHHQEHLHWSEVSNVSSPQQRVKNWNAVVVALTLPPLSTDTLFFNGAERQWCKHLVVLKQQSCSVARQCKTSSFALLLSCSPPVYKPRQYKTSSSPGLSPNLTRQNKIFLLSAKIRPPKFNKEELNRGVTVNCFYKWQVQVKE